MGTYKYNGTGNTGTFAWYMQRVSGVIIAITGMIIFYQLAFAGSHNVDGYLLMPVLAFGLWHTLSGLKMVTDDYVSCPTKRLILVIIYWGIGIAALAMGLSVL